MGQFTTNQVKEAYRDLIAAKRNPAEYYPYQNFVGPTGTDMAAWDNRLTYQDQVFGGQNPLQYGNATDSLNALMSGNTDMGALSSGYGSQALSSLDGWNQFGQAGGLDANPAISRMLSGTPDYSGLQGAIDAANAPILRQFNEEIMPGLNSRATFLNNETGGIKALNKILPDIGERMSMNANTLYNQERNRALSDQAQAAGMVAQGGLSENQGLLGLGGLAGNLAGGVSGDAIRATGLFPSMYEMGLQPGTTSSQFADWQRSYMENALNDDMARYNYAQNAPRDNAQWYAQQVGNLTAANKAPSGGGGSSSGGGLLGALGGAATGASLAGTLGMSSGWGAALGAAASFL